MSINLNLPLRTWTPRWMGGVILLLAFIPTAMMSGTYVASISEVSGVLGTIGENIL